ncbi:Hus1-like protein, partial [Aureobasidium melanogenum]
MRFRADIKNNNVFTKLTASLASLGPVAWVKLSNEDVRFTVIPDQGSSVWAALEIDQIFETYTIQSAAENNTINLEVPLQNLHRALKSAQNASHASIRLTKKNNIPLLSLTITTAIFAGAPKPTFQSGPPDEYGYNTGFPPGDEFGNQFPTDEVDEPVYDRPNRETIITQDIPIKVLSPAVVSGLHEPRSREPDVHIVLPPLLQLKSISDRFTKLAVSSTKTPNGSTGFRGSTTRTPKLELSANMHGCLKLRLKTDAMDISSRWTGLSNPELDPTTVEGGEEGIAQHPSTLMRTRGDPEGISDEGWAVVRLDGKDWGKVLGIGRVGGRVIACFCNEHALILYVYLPNEEVDVAESVITYYIIIFININTIIIITIITTTIDTICIIIIKFPAISPATTLPSALPSTGHQPAISLPSACHQPAISLPSISSALPSLHHRLTCITVTMHLFAFFFLFFLFFSAAFLCLAAPVPKISHPAPVNSPSSSLPTTANSTSPSVHISTATAALVNLPTTIINSCINCTIVEQGSGSPSSGLHMAGPAS